MRAHDAEVGKLIAIDSPCDGCVLAEGHKVSPDYIEASGVVDDERGMATRLTVSSFNGHLNATEVDVPGILRKDQIIKELNTVEQMPSPDEQLACNALCAMVLRRRG